MIFKQAMMENSSRETAATFGRVLYDFLAAPNICKRADCMIVLGCDDIRVADHAGKLALLRMAPVIVFSGACGRNTKDIFSEPEATIFYRSVQHVIPKDVKVHLERMATNTGENIEFSIKLCDENSLQPESVMLVTKPLMCRRALATFQARYPQKRVIVSAPTIKFEDYPNVDISLELTLNTMVGNLDRLIKYPALGFQSEVSVPDHVICAFRQLIQLGYDQQLLSA